MKTVVSMKTAKGFTLLEVLLVVFLIGMAATVTTVALPGADTLEGTANEQAEKLQMIMEEIAERSAMEGRIIGLRIEKDSYAFMMLQKSSKKTVVADKSSMAQFMLSQWDQLSWVDYKNENLATKMKFDEGITASLEIGGLSLETSDTTLDTYKFEEEAHNAKPVTPQILFYPTGEVTPFRLRLNLQDEPRGMVPVMIIGSEVGTFRMFDPEKDRV